MTGEKILKIPNYKFSIYYKCNVHHKHCACMYACVYTYTCAHTCQYINKV